MIYYELLDKISSILEDKIEETMAIKTKIIIQNSEK